MKVTREVIYDLLPAYFAGEVSGDTRALIEEFFTTDPEFGRMAERFRTLNEERTRSSTVESEADRQRELFDRARARVKLRQSAVAFAFGAAMSLGMMFLVPMEGRISLRHPGLIIGIVFGAMALFNWAVSYRSNPEYWSRTFLEGYESKSSEMKDRTKRHS